MKLNYDEVSRLPDGTELKVFLSGSEWDDFGKTFNAIKIKDKLYITTGYHDLDDIVSIDGFDIVVAQK